MIDIGKTPLKSVSRNMAEATVRFVGDDSEEIGENHDNFRDGGAEDDLASNH